MNMASCQTPARKIFDKLPFEVVDPKEGEFPKLGICEYFYSLTTVKVKITFFGHGIIPVKITSYNFYNKKCYA